MINLDYTFADKYIGASFRINIDVTNPDNGNPTDPTSVTISSVNPDGTLFIDDVTVTRDAEGDYHYDYTVPSIEGAYKGHTECTSSGGLITVKTFGFWAEASI